VSQAEYRESLPRGVPGDFTPPSRFVRAAIFSKTAVPSNTAQSGVEQVFHILNNFDIPVGVSREVTDGVPANPMR